MIRTVQFLTNYERNGTNVTENYLNHTIPHENGWNRTIPLNIQIFQFPLKYKPPQKCFKNEKFTANYSAKYKNSELCMKKLSQHHI